MYAMGGAASFSAPPITEEAIVHERARGSAVALSPSPPHVTHVSTHSSFQSSQRRHEHACIARSWLADVASRSGQQPRVECAASADVAWRLGERYLSSGRWAM